MEPSPIGPSPPAGREDRVAFGWLARLFGHLMALYVRLVARTARFSGPPVSQQQMILAIWHESNLVTAAAAYRLWHDNKAVVFSTRGFRGIVMNTMLAKIGSGVVTLPDPDAGRQAEAASLARTMARIGQSGWNLVIACDGPLGPYRVAKPGVLIVARESGLAVQPWALAIRPHVRLNGRWDRHLVPLPFGRIRVYEGRPMEVGPRDRLKPLLAELQAELDRVAALADRRMDKA
jgi:hypothetical protein